MSGVGLEWYKRQPTAYLKDVQGLSMKEHAVFSVVLDLIYQHGGSVNNDPKFIAGWISDMGAAAVRRAISSLVERGMLMVEGDQLTQKRARSEAKTKQKPSENGEKTEEKHQKNSSDFEGAANENNDLPPLEKRREEKSKNTHPNGCGADAPVGDDFWAFSSRILQRSGISDRQARSLLGKWTKAKGRDDVRRLITDAMQAADPVAYVEASMPKKAEATEFDSEQFWAKLRQGQEELRAGW